MFPHNQNIIEISTLISGASSVKKPIHTTIKRCEILEYVQSMVEGLCEISNDADNQNLTFLLELTAKEAQLAKETAELELSFL